MSVLSCSVRGCGQALARGGRTFSCPAGHSHDITRSGYVNLLQPQDRRSPQAGDTKASVEARARLLDDGIGRASLESVMMRAARLDLAPSACVVDLGCGSGDALTMLQALGAITGVGIDLSVAAIDRAARRHPGVTWVVANADRRIPVLDRRAALVMSLNGRRNPAESARILEPGGRLLVAVPAPDDLIELRALVQGRAVEQPRGEALLAGHAEYFDLIERSVVREHNRLERDQVIDVLLGTYRGRRTSAAARVEALPGMEITLAMETFLFSPR